MAKVYINPLINEAFKVRDLRVESRHKRTVSFKACLDNHDSKAGLIDLTLLCDSQYDILLEDKFKQALEQFVGNGSVSVNREASAKKTFSWRLNQRAGLLALEQAFNHYETFIRKFLENHEK